MARIVLFGGLPESLINFRGQLLSALVEAGHEVHAIASGVDGITEDALSEIGVTYHNIAFQRTGLNPIVDLTSLLNLYSLLKRLKPDFLLSYTIKPVIYGSIAARFSNVPNVFSMITGLGHAFFDRSLKGRVVGYITRVLYQVSLKNNRSVFFQNQNNIEVFESYNLLRSKEQAVLINGSGVDLEHYAPVGLPEKISFLMIARLLRDKGVYEYVLAARQIKAIHPEVEFKLVGWIDDNPAAISKKDLDGWVADGTISYLGCLRDVRPAIAGASVYVLPSYHEGMPRTVLEAMSMGRPVITTDIPGCRETVVDGENGYLVPAQDHEPLAIAMQRFIDDPSCISKMGLISQQMASNEFDVHKVNNTIIGKMGLYGEKTL